MLSLPSGRFSIGWLLSVPMRFSLDSHPSRTPENSRSAGKPLKPPPPWVILADTHDSWARPEAKGKVGSAVLLIASPAEADGARDFGYRDVRYVGGPPFWQEHLAVQPADIGRHHPEDKVILVSGIKDAKLTDRMLNVVIEAGNALLDEWGLIFRPHPNEDKATQDPERRAKILQGTQLIESAARTDALVLSADVSVFSGGATETIFAARRRRPVIFYEDEDIRQRNIRQISKPTWFPAESGACLKAGVSSGDRTIRPTVPMVEAIRTLLTKEGHAALRKRQEEVYPDAPPGEPVETRILTLLTELTGKQ